MELLQTQLESRREKHMLKYQEEISLLTEENKAPILKGNANQSKNSWCMKKNQRITVNNQLIIRYP